jgi:hypothetical protein
MRIIYLNFDQDIVLIADITAINAEFISIYPE